MVLVQPPRCHVGSSVLLLLPSIALNLTSSPCLLRPVCCFLLSSFTWESLTAPVSASRFSRPPCCCALRSNALSTGRSYTAVHSAYALCIGCFPAAGPSVPSSLPPAPLLTLYFAFLRLPRFWEEFSVSRHRGPSFALVHVPGTSVCQAFESEWTWLQLQLRAYSMCLLLSFFLA